MKIAKLEGIILLLLVLATNKWMPWQEGIAYLQADDSRSYEVLAQAAPGLPELGSGSLYHHAQRIFIHYLVGSIAYFTKIDLGLVYHGAACLLMLLVVWTLQNLLIKLELADFPRRILLAAFVFNPYVFRYYGLAPTLLADLVFVLGMGVLFRGLVDGKFAILLFGAVLAMLGRQSALLLIPGVAAWIWWGTAWRAHSANKKMVYIATISVLWIVLYQALGYFVLPFTGRVVHGAGTFITFFTWLVGDTFTWRILAEHILRVFLPAILILALSFAWFFGNPPSARSALSAEFWAAWLIAAGLGSQPLVVNPIEVGQNQSRQSAIALLAAVVATAYLFRKMPNRWANTGVLLLIVAGIAGTSIHHMYTIAGPPNAAWFALLHLAACGLAGFGLWISTMILSGKYAKR